MRLLLYVTTHLSVLHRSFLSLCWPAMLKQIHVDYNVTFFITADSKKKNWTTVVRWMTSLFPIASIITSDTQGKQQGAIAAMTHPQAMRPFSSFDWVIRLNPDVMIYNPSYIIDLMTPNRDAVLCNCNQNEREIRVMTDFIIFRPHAINIHARQSVVAQYTRFNQTINAEKDFTRMISPTLKSRKYIWLWHSNDTSCRVRLPGIVYHEHTLHRCLASDFV